MPTDILTPQQIFRKQAAGEPIQPGEEEQVHRHVITVLLENSIGALNRVANMFSARGFNLESVAVGETDDANTSRMTLVTTGNDRIIGQVIRQLNNLVDTLVVDDLTQSEYVERELCLLKVSYSTDTRAELMDIVDIFRGKVVNITPETMTFELTGPTTKINAFVGMMRPHGIVEVARSGRVAMRRNMAFEHGRKA
jgi:acetolactate synthase-1/3 small subunit